MFMNNDRIYGAYMGDMGAVFQEKTKTRIDAILGNIGSNCEILDIGCSQGIISILAAQKGNQVLGIDIDQEAIDFARELVSSGYSELKDKVSFISGDFLLLNLEKKFDYILITEVLEHVSDPVQFLSMAKKHLKKDGRIIATVPFGVNNHPDHNSTYYMADFISLFDGFLNVEKLFFVDRWIGAVVGNQEKVLNIFDEEVLKAYEKNLFNIDSEMTFSIETLRSNNTQINEKYKIALENYEKAKEWLENRNLQIDRVNAEYNDLKFKYQNTYEQVTELNDKYKIALENYEKAKEWLEERNTQIDRVNTEYNDLKCKYQNTCEQVTELNEKYEVANAEYNDLNFKYKNICEQNKQLRLLPQEIEMLKEQMELCSKELLNAYNNNSEDSMLFRELKAKIQKMEIQNNYLKGENNVYRKKLQLITDTFWGRFAIKCYRLLKKLKIKFTR